MDVELQILKHLASDAQPKVSLTGTLTVSIGNYAVASPPNSTAPRRETGVLGIAYRP